MLNKTNIPALNCAIRMINEGDFNDNLDQIQNAFDKLMLEEIQASNQRVEDILNVLIAIRGSVKAKRIELLNQSLKSTSSL